MKVVWSSSRIGGQDSCRKKPSRHTPFGPIIIVMVVITIILSSSPAVYAEVRSYLQLSTRLLSGSERKQGLKADMFVKEESRYRESGLVLNKLFIGIKPIILPWLSSQFYYANKDMNYGRHLNKHMLVGDIILLTRFEPFGIKNRGGNEWHISDNFYRYRNYSEFDWRTPVKVLTLWAAEEWRFDSDQSRVNMNDIRLGITLSLRKKLNSRIFFDLESNRRNSDHWQDKPFLGMSLDIH